MCALDIYKNPHSADTQLLKAEPGFCCALGRVPAEMIPRVSLPACCLLYACGISAAAYIFLYPIYSGNASVGSIYAHVAHRTPITPEVALRHDDRHADTRGILLLSVLVYRQLQVPE